MTGLSPTSGSPLVVKRKRLNVGVAPSTSTIFPKAVSVRYPSPPSTSCSSLICPSLVIAVTSASLTPPPVTVTVGATVYPLPVDSICTPLNLPNRREATRLAPEPAPSSVKTRAGIEVYPSPFSTISTSVTVPVNPDPPWPGWTSILVTWPF